MNVKKRIAQCALSIGLATAALSPLRAETDVYGNEIIKDGDGNVTYQFWKSGTKAEDASVERSSSMSFVPADMFESRARTLLSRITAVVTTPWRGLGLFLVVR